jgi:DNA primase
LDAISIDGTAILGAEIMDKQAMLINRLNKQVILVPDRDPSGQRSIEQAIELGWAVSMPNWEPNIKDINDAVRRYGKLYTLYSIITQADTNELKIRLKMKKWR